MTRPRLFWGTAALLPMLLAAGPVLADQPKIPAVDTGDTAWMLSSTALVLPSRQATPILPVVTSLKTHPAAGPAVAEELQRPLV